LKILKIWSSFQTEFKYHDHYLSEIMQNYKIKTIFLTSDKIDKEYLPFLDKKTIIAGDDEYNGSKIIRLKSIEFMRKPFILEIKKMYEELCKKDYDLIHIFGIGNPITFLTLIILKFCKKKILIIANDHSNPNFKNISLVGKIYYKINIFLFSKLNKQVSLIITPNTATKNFIKEHYSIEETKMKIIPLGYDANIFTYNKNINHTDSQLLIGFAGKILPGKKLELLIDVLSEIDNENISCIIVGMNNPETDYQKSLRMNTKSLRISFRPLIKDPRELAYFYNYIDLAIFPGSISITTLEANGCGTPVIIYNSIEGLEDRVEDNRGFLFNTKEELKKYILLYKRLKELNSIENQNIAQKSQKYSWQEISKLYIDIYNQNIQKEK